MPLLLALSVAIVLADSSVVTLALPAILRDFDASVAAVAWVLIAFNLALALAAVGGARLARGRGRTAFVVSSVAFALASLACAAAPSLDALVVARAVQGIVGAVVVAAALELLLASTQRARAIGLWAAAGVLGGARRPGARRLPHRAVLVAGDVRAAGAGDAAGARRRWRARSRGSEDSLPQRRGHAPSGPRRRRSSRSRLSPPRCRPRCFCSS